MSGIPGFNSPLARAICRLALWVENIDRRWHGKPRLTGDMVIRINGVGYRGELKKLVGNVGGVPVEIEPFAPERQP